MSAPSPGLDRCPQCAAAVRPGDPWCTLCYADLRPAPPPPPAQAPAPLPPASPGQPTGAPLDPPPAALPPAGAAQAPAGGPPGRAHAAAPPPDQGLSGPSWPCASCGAANPFERDTCATCGAPFLSGLKDQEAPLLELPVVGDLTKLGRGQRLGLAGGVVLAVVLVTLLLGLLLH